MQQQLVKGGNQFAVAYLTNNFIIYWKKKQIFYTIFINNK